MTFRIYRDGSVKDMQLTQSSGNISMDNSAQRALLSQYPMLLLMVMYTMTSLWILAQPTTSGA